MEKNQSTLYDDEYVLRSEITELNRKLSMLLDLVGDMPVSEQIEMALKNIK